MLPIMVRIHKIVGRKSNYVLLLLLKILISNGLQNIFMKEVYVFIEISILKKSIMKVLSTKRKYIQKDLITKNNQYIFKRLNVLQN